jgi:hypothetical protein
MAWRDLLLVVIRCEFQAKYHCITGWQVSAKGALPVILVALGATIALLHG